MIKRGLIVKEPYATMIVKGIKKWELRKRKTSIRERVYIVSSGYIIGSVKIKDVRGPFDLQELKEFYELHKVSYEFLYEYSKGRKLYAWVLEDPISFEKPIKIKVPKGAQIWIKINELKWNV